MPKLETNRRWHIASRTFAAVLLGYLLANTVGLLLSLGLPLDRVSGLVLGTLMTFLVWGLASMWVFWVERTRTAWLGLAGGVLITGTLAAFFYFLENSA
ncbi:MAG: hypothetical protein AAF993_08560 [Pseudomonadota bacterium]